MELSEIFDKFCSLIKEEMSDVSYKTWIRDSVKLVAINGDTAHFEYLDMLHKNMLSRYQMLITTSIGLAAGKKLNVSFVSAEEAATLAKTKPEETSSAISTTLNPKYTFDTFIVGSSNRFARAASLAVAEAPAEAYNPLFIYGGVGLGKTHLMHAIGHHIQHEYPSMRLLYISSESFTNELIMAIQKNRNADFRERFRSVDVLMVDDIQFIAGRDSTQEEFFHTFNALHTSGKQIIISSDRPPKEISRLEERLRSRFEWGLIADVQKPDIETRNAILQRKAEADGLEIDVDVLKLIAERVDTNIRELEGSLNRVVAYAQLAGKPITVSLAMEAMRDMSAAKDKNLITTRLIMQCVCEYCGVTMQDLTSNKRNRQVTLPRQIAMFLTRELTAESLPHIGGEFGGRDHSTVLHSTDKIKEELITNPSVKQIVEDLRKIIAEK
jgi:chromosomal replication initiator protein